MVARALVDGALAPQRRFHRHDGHAVALHAAIAAAFADVGVNHRPLRQRRHQPLFATAPFFRRTRLHIDDDGDALQLAHPALQCVHRVAVQDFDTRWHARCAVIGLRIVTHQKELGDALGGELLQQLHRGGRAFDRLAARHGDRVVHQQFVGDIDPRRPRRTDRQRTRVHVSAVTQVDEAVLLRGEGRMADPAHALAAHLGEGGGAPVHPLHHVMATDAGTGLRAFGHFRAGVVRATGAKVGHALRQRRGAVGGCARLLARRQPRTHRLGQRCFAQHLGQARSDDAGDHRRRQLAIGREQDAIVRHLHPFTGFVVLADDTRAGAGRLVVEMFLDLVFEHLAFFFHHQDFIQPLRELDHTLRLQRPHDADLQ